MSLDELIDEYEKRKVQLQSVAEPEISQGGCRNLISSLLTGVIIVNLVLC